MSRKITLPSPWKELAEKVGGVAALAEACHASKMSVWRWATGKCLPHPRERGALVDLARIHKIKLPPEIADSVPRRDKRRATAMTVTLEPRAFYLVDAASGEAFTVMPDPRFDGSVTKVVGLGPRPVALRALGGIEEKDA
jgi:hypothetical protein